MFENCYNQNYYYFTILNNLIFLSLINIMVEKLFEKRQGIKYTLIFCNINITMRLIETERIEIIITIDCRDQMRTQNQVCNLFKNKYKNRKRINQLTVKLRMNSRRLIMFKICLKGRSKASDFIPVLHEQVQMFIQPQFLIY